MPRPPAVRWVALFAALGLGAAGAPGARAAGAAPGPPPAAGESPPAASAPEAATPLALEDPSCFTAVLVPSPGVAVTRLPRGFLRAGTDSVWSRAGAWLAGRDYRLDRLRGDLRPDDEAVVVRVGRAAGDRPDRPEDGQA